MIFLDLKKAYDTLGRGQAIRVLQGYGVGANLLRLIQASWAGDTMIPRQAGYYGRPFKDNRGVRQRDILSPLIFNIMVDAVVRNWRSAHLQRGSDETAIFYTDDGLISSTSASAVQESMDFLSRDFLSLGQRMNHRKTQFMVMTGGRSAGKISARAANRLYTGTGPTYQERQL